MRLHADTQTPPPLPQDDQVDLAVEVFRMLADPTRVKLLWLLAGGECPVNELAAAAGSRQTSVSQHLAKLRMARLVATRRNGNQVFYRLESDHIRQLVQDAVFHAEHASGRVPEHHRSQAVTPLEATHADRGEQASVGLSDRRVRVGLDAAADLAAKGWVCPQQPRAAQ